MKKFWMLTLLVAVLGTTSVQAQTGNDGADPQVMMARMKERLKPQLIEKVKLTDAQADKVVEINFDNMRQRRDLRDLSQEDRQKKMGELNADRNKKLAAIPLTEEQVKAVNNFFDEMRRNAPQRNGNRQQ